jgi:hypothetical protein
MGPGHTSEFESVQDLVEVGKLCLLLEDGPDRLLWALDGPGKLVDILRLDDSLQVVLQELLEVVLQLGATVVLDDVLPRVLPLLLPLSQVGLELAAENLERRGLADTVGPNKTENVPGSGHRQTVELEAVGRVSVGDLRLEVGREVDDGDGAKRALAHADTATDTERLRDEGDARLGRHFDAELTASDDGARLLAFLPALFGLALVFRDDRDTAIELAVAVQNTPPSTYGVCLRRLEPTE